MEAKTGKAVFVHRPRRIEDLRGGFDGKQPPRYTSYIIEAEVTLDWIDYENFITDMLADRWFLEEHGGRCFVDAQGSGDVIHCLLVSAKGRASGILVLPKGDHVARAALYPDGT